MLAAIHTGFEFWRRALPAIKQSTPAARAVKPGAAKLGPAKPGKIKRSLAVILAAGEGTRMKSRMPKVLHQIAGRPMLGHVLAAVKAAGITDIAVVVGPNHADVADCARKQAVGVEVFRQTERLGTAHAALQARKAIARGYDSVIVLFGDTPLVTPETIARMAAAVGGRTAVAALGFQAKDPAGYGRFIVRNGLLTAIREHKDASATERRITLCNGGLMALAGSSALNILDRISNANAQQEFYLTDAPEIARKLGLKAVPLETTEQEILGINDRAQLAGAEALMQQRLRLGMMKAGVTLLDPASVSFSFDTKIEADVIVEPGVFFGLNVRIASGAVIRAWSHLEGAEIGPGATVGPFARLRSGTVLGKNAKIGNFVETKNAILGAGAKVSHLTYLGDADIGADANIGAGTITCNYDGFLKYRTTIGAGAFIGSNSALVAPVTIGEGAYIGSGSVITGDVPADALAVGRGRQVVKPGWAVPFRARMAAEKARKQRK